MQEASLTYDQFITPVYWSENFKPLVPSSIKSVTRFYIIFTCNKEQPAFRAQKFGGFIFALQKQVNLLCWPFVLKVKWAAQKIIPWK